MEPERLEVGRPVGRRTGRLVLVLSLVVVMALAVVRLGVGRPAPVPGSGPSGTASASTVASSSNGWPVGVGLPAGTVWVLTDDGVSRVDVASGFVEHLGLEVDPARTTLTPLAPGAVAWSGDGQDARLLGFDADSSGPLRAVWALLPGPTGTVWVRAARPADGTATWVEAGARGAVGPRVTVRGTAVADGSGGLLEVRGDTVRHDRPGCALDLGRARVLAAGPDGYVLDRCAGTCTAELHRTDGQVTPVATEAAPNPQHDPSDLAPGSVSPGNRFLEEVLPTEVGDQVRVSRVSPVAEVLRTFPAGGRRATSTWLSDRWLLAASGDHLVLYDATTDALLAVGINLPAPSQVVFVPA